MLYRLAEYQSMPQPRASDLTYVDHSDSPMMGSKNLQEPGTPTGTGTRVTYAATDERRLAGKPHAELGPEQ